jgi:hypothetical protein
VQLVVVLLLERTQPEHPRYSLPGRQHHVSQMRAPEKGSWQRPVVPCPSPASDIVGLIAQPASQQAVNVLPNDLRHAACRMFGLQSALAPGLMYVACRMFGRHIALPNGLQRVERRILGMQKCPIEHATCRMFGRAYAKWANIMRNAACLEGGTPCQMS